jgi:phosphatidylinositol alpha-1,6-mannosyltransferase
MFKIGGMQRVGIDLLKQLEARNDIDVGSFVLHSAGLSQYMRFHTFMLSTAFRILKMINHGEIDAVIFSAMPSATMAMLLGAPARRAGVPMVAIAHGHDVIFENFFYQRMLKSIFTNLSGVLAVSKSTADACSARGLDSSSLFITPNGINLNRFANFFPGLKTTRAERRDILLKTLPHLAGRLPPKAFVLESIGRQVKRKGHEWFVRSVMPLLDPNVHLLLGGQGPEATKIAQAVNEAGMAGRVHTLGLVPEEKLAGLYTGADLFIMPNIPVRGDMEGFGMVMLEAGLCGLPTIAARLEGIQDVITEGVNGFTVASMDHSGFAEKISRLAKNPALLDALSLSARTHTLASFSWEAITEKIVGTIHELIAQQNSSGQSHD